MGLIIINACLLSVGGLISLLLHSPLPFYIGGGIAITFNLGFPCALSFELLPSKWSNSKFTQWVFGD